jgi:hypothetical protein
MAELRGVVVGHHRETMLDLVDEFPRQSLLIKLLLRQTTLVQSEPEHPPSHDGVDGLTENLSDLLRCRRPHTPLAFLR